MSCQQKLKKELIEKLEKLDLEGRLDLIGKDDLSFLKMPENMYDILGLTININIAFAQSTLRRLGEE